MESENTVANELRLVAIIWPKSSWGIQEDPNELARLAVNEDECNTPTLCRVGRLRSDPNKRGCWSTFCAGERSVDEWAKVLDALNKPILYAKDIDYFDGSIAY